jgi:hypothetical protein
VFNFLKKALGAKATEQPPPPPMQAALPLNLRVGASVHMDLLRSKMLGDALLVRVTNTQQIVEARGVIDLEQGNFLHRFYLNDEEFLQLSVQGDHLHDIKLFQFADTKKPSSRAALDAWLKPGRELGQHSIDYRGKPFQRVWGEPETNWAPPVVFDELVYKQGAQPAYDLTHYAMLYQREVAAEQFEYLLISVEDSGPNDFSVVYSLGIDLSSADLEVF